MQGMFAEVYRVFQSLKNMPKAVVLADNHNEIYKISPMYTTASVMTLKQLNPMLNT